MDSNDLLKKTQDDEKYFKMQYSVPPDNPFRNTPGAREEIYALGIKNMWRCSVDRGNRKTGKSFFL